MVIAGCLALALKATPRPDDAAAVEPDLTGAR